MQSRLVASLALFGSIVGSRAASAQPRPPGLTVARGVVSATLTLESDASRDAFGDRMSLAPDLSVGLTDDLTVSVVHSTFGRTGFRGAAGAGVCVTEPCPRTYDNAGVEALYSLVRGPLAVAANVGVHATSFDSDHYAAKLGAKLRYTAGKLSLVSLPSVFVALTNRDAPMPNRDRVWLPVSATYQLPGGLSAGVATGFKAPLQDLAEGYEIAAGAVAQYALAPGMIAGASWVFGRMIAGDAVLPDDQRGRDSRALQLWLTVTR